MTVVTLEGALTMKPVGRKVTKIGDSLGITVPQKISDSLGVNLSNIVNLEVKDNKNEDILKGSANC